MEQKKALLIFGAMMFLFSAAYAESGVDSNGNFVITGKVYDGDTNMKPTVLAEAQSGAIKAERFCQRCWEQNQVQAELGESTRGSQTPGGYESSGGTSGRQ